MAWDESAIREAAKKIRLLVLDVDGVLTDGGIILDGGENELKCFHVRDGHGIKMFIRAGLQVAIITGRHSLVVDRRARELGISEVYQRCHDKTVAYQHLLEKLDLSGEEVAYVGDDVVDIPLFRRVGLPVAVQDAGEETKSFAGMITRLPGGRGAVREVCEMLLKAQGLWDSAMEAYREA